MAEFYSLFLQIAAIKRCIMIMTLSQDTSRLFALLSMEKKNSFFPLQYLKQPLGEHKKQKHSPPSSSYNASVGSTNGSGGLYLAQEQDLISTVPSATRRTDIHSAPAAAAKRSGRQNSI